MQRLSLFRRSLLAARMPPEQALSAGEWFDLLGDDMLEEILLRVSHCGADRAGLASVCRRFRICLLRRCHSLAVSHTPQLRVFCYTSALTDLRIAPGACPLLLTRMHAVDIAALTALTSLTIDRNCRAVSPSCDSTPWAASLRRLSMHSASPALAYTLPSAAPAPASITHRLLAALGAPLRALTACAAPPPVLAVAGTCLVTAAAYVADAVAATQ